MCLPRIAVTAFRDLSILNPSLHLPINMAGIYSDSVSITEFCKRFEIVKRYIGINYGIYGILVYGIYDIKLKPIVP